MKKLVSLFALLGLMTALVACASAASSSTAASSSSAASSVPEAASSEAAPASAVSETSTECSHTLVAYFSCTGTTEGIAQKLAEQTDAALYVITPAQPYTTDDLNYNDNSCRANQEMNDASARPELGGEEINLSPYDTIYLGYPIWWGTAPRIIQTFIESHDWDGKTVYLFCTSGSSGAEKSLHDLQNLYPDINFAAAKRFSANASDSDISGWLDSLH